MKVLSNEFLRNLVKKDELKSSGMKPIFADNELEVIKDILKNHSRRFNMRDKTFVVRYFKFRGKEWVTVRPTRGFVPMFSGPYDQILKADII